MSFHHLNTNTIAKERRKKQFFRFVPITLLIIYYVFAMVDFQNLTIRTNLSGSTFLIILMVFNLYSIYIADKAFNKKYTQFAINIQETYISFLNPLDGEITMRAKEIATIYRTAKGQYIFKSFNNSFYHIHYALEDDETFQQELKELYPITPIAKDAIFEYASNIDLFMNIFFLLAVFRMNQIMGIICIALVTIGDLINWYLYNSTTLYNDKFKKARKINIFINLVFIIMISFQIFNN